MAAQSPAQRELISSQRATGGIAIPASWRVGQLALIAVVLLTAIWYAVTGYHSPANETRAADNFSPFDLVGFGMVALLIFLTTPTAWVVATTTFQEAIRRKWMSALLGFAVVMLGVSTFFTWMQPGSEQKFLRDYGLGFTVIITLIAAVFLGVALIPPEIERRTIFTILSKPVTRLEFLVGKYLGLMLTLALNLLVMSTIFLISYGLFVVKKDGADALTGANFFANISHWPQAFALANAHDNMGVSINGVGSDLVNLARALLLHLGTLSIMAAFAMMLSQFLTGITAIIISFVVYFLGQSAAYWERLTGGAPVSAAEIPAGETLQPDAGFDRPRFATRWTRSTRCCRDWIASMCARRLGQRSANRLELHVQSRFVGRNLHRRDARHRLLCVQRTRILKTSRFSAKQRVWRVATHGFCPCKTPFPRVRLPKEKTHGISKNGACWLARHCSWSHTI